MLRGWQAKMLKSGAGDVQTHGVPGSGHLSEACRTLLDNAASVIDVNYCEDPRYKLVVDDLE